MKDGKDATIEMCKSHTKELKERREAGKGYPFGPNIHNLRGLEEPEEEVLAFGMTRGELTALFKSPEEIELSTEELKRALDAVKTLEEVDKLYDKIYPFHDGHWKMIDDKKDSMCLDAAKRTRSIKKLRLLNSQAPAGGKAKPFIFDKGLRRVLGETNTIEEVVDLIDQAGGVSESQKAAAVQRITDIASRPIIKTTESNNQNN